MTMALVDTLLVERDCLGYPGMTCELHVEDFGNYRVLIRTPVRCYEFKTRSRAEARDWYFHPFVYGVEYRQPDYYGGESDGA